MVSTSFPAASIQASHVIVPETPVDRRRTTPHVDFIFTRDGALLPTEEGDVTSTLAPTMSSLASSGSSISSLVSLGPSTLFVPCTSSSTSFHTSRPNPHVLEATVLPPHRAPREGRRVKRRRLSDASPFPSDVSSVIPASPRRGKGSKHANACPGPFAIALDSMPDLPLTSGARRQAAGLGSVPLPRAHVQAVRRRRAAHALVSILPFGSAAFITSDPEHVITARPVSETIARMVDALSAHGVTSLDGAFSAYGRLKQWVRVHHPDATEIIASHVTDFHRAHGSSINTLQKFDWLRDHCGVDLFSRAPVSKRFRIPGSSRDNSKESITLAVMEALSRLSSEATSPFVRAHAAAWFTMGKGALRYEQASSCVVNAVVPWPPEAPSFRVMFGSVVSDKNPDRDKMRPRPFWAVVDALDGSRAVLDALLPMLGLGADVRCLLLDTDSPDGSPLQASGWVLSPPSSPRALASLRGVLHAAGVPEEAATLFRHHSFKRFILNAVESDPAMNSLDANEVGRFADSTAQSDDLEPVAAMLQRHEARVSVLPARYAHKAKVRKCIDRLCAIELSLRSARSRAAQGSHIPYLDGWDLFQPPEAPIPLPASAF